MDLTAFCVSYRSAIFLSVHSSLSAGGATTRPIAPTPGAPRDWEDWEHMSTAHELEIQARIDASTKRMVRTAHEASACGAATLSELNQQGDILRRVRADQQVIEDNLATSDRLLRGLESWRGSATYAFSSWWYGEDSTSSSGGSGGDDGGKRAIAAPDSSSSISTTRANVTPSAATANREGSLSELSSIVSGLCAQANAMNAEISAQSATIDAALMTADAQSMRIQRNTQRSRAAGGR